MEFFKQEKNAKRICFIRHKFQKDLPAYLRPLLGKLLECDTTEGLHVREFGSQNNLWEEAEPQFVFEPSMTFQEFLEIEGGETMDSPETWQKYVKSITVTHRLLDA